MTALAVLVGWVVLSPALSLFAAQVLRRAGGGRR